MAQIRQLRPDYGLGVQAKVRKTLQVVPSSLGSGSHKSGTHFESQLEANLLFFFFIILKPRVERYTKSTSLKYEPALEPLHIYVK